MSVSIRISDEIYEEINSVEPSEMSFGKTADALLKIAIKCLDDEDGNDESGDDFPEKIKRISEKQSYEKEDVEIGRPHNLYPLATESKYITCPQCNEKIELEATK